LTSGVKIGVKILKFIVLVLLFACGAATAMDAQATRQEVSLGYGLETSSRFTSSGVQFNSDAAPATSGNGPFYGPSVRYTFNLTQHFALEGVVREPIGDQTEVAADGGEELMAFCGLKAGIHRGRWDIFGTLQPGLATFSLGLQYYAPVDGSPGQRLTHFVLEEGFGASRSVGKHTSLRLDFMQFDTAEFSRTVSPSGAYTFGKVAQHHGLDLSITHSFGHTLREEPLEGGRGMKTSLGIFVPVQIRRHLLFGDPQANPGYGAWIGHDFTPHFSVDALALALPHEDHTASPQDGGPSKEGFFGPKAGIQTKKIGVFVKVRPGAIRFAHTDDSVLTNPVLVTHEVPKFDFVLDAGGVVEWHAGRGFLLRAEGGNVTIFYAPTTQHTDGKGTFFPGFQENSALMLVGAGWSF
jgi:hypothetical protein